MSEAQTDMSHHVETNIQQKVIQDGQKIQQNKQWNEMMPEEARNAIEDIIIQILPPPPKKQLEIEFDLNAYIEQLVLKGIQEIKEKQNAPEEKSKDEESVEFKSKQKTREEHNEQKKEEIVQEATLLTQIVMKPSQQIQKVQKPQITIPKQPQKRKKSWQQTLNPQNPADKALALSLRMVRRRKQHEINQLKMLAEYRTRHKAQEQQLLTGHVSRIIQKQNYLKGNRYLREDHYATLAPISNRKLNNSYMIPKMTLEQQRSTIRKQSRILAKCKNMNKHYQAKKIVMDLLQQVIGRSVELYHKKSKYPLKSGKRSIAMALGESMVRSRARNKSLGLSRAYDLTINQEEKEQSVNQAQEEQEQEQLSSRAPRSEIQSQLSSDSQGQSQGQKQQEESDSNNINQESFS